MTFCTLDNLLRIERRGLLASKKPDNIFDDDRESIISLIFDVSFLYKINIYTRLLALNIFDIYMDKRSINHTAIYPTATIAIASLTLASKKQDIYPIDLEDFVEMTGDNIGIPELIHCELDIVLTVHGDFNTLNFRDFLHALNGNLPLLPEISILCDFLGEFVTAYIPGIYLPSVIATSIYAMSSFILAHPPDSVKRNDKLGSTDCNIIDIAKYISDNMSLNITNISPDVLQRCINDILDGVKSMYLSKRGMLPVGYNSSLVSDISSIIKKQIRKIDVEATFIYRTYMSQICDVLAFASDGRIIHLDEEFTCKFYKDNWTPSPIINTNYTKIQAIGEGTHGAVTKIKYNDSETFALKRTRHECFCGDGMELSFLRELSILTLAVHKNIVSLKGINLCIEKGFLLLECMDSDLRTFCDKATVSPRYQFKIVKQLCKGVKFLHDLGIIHRDIKPQNILISTKNDNISAKIADFGIGKGGGITTIPILTTGVCTLWYRPPEVILGSNYDQRLDIWSLGCSIYELATSNPLFAGDSEIDQLYHIFIKCGTPNDDTWPGVCEFKHYRDNFPQWKESNIWPDGLTIHVGIKTLVEKCVIMNVSSKGSQPKRIYADDLLPTLTNNNFTCVIENKQVPNTRISTVDANWKSPIPAIVIIGVDENKAQKWSIDHSQQAASVIKQYMNLYHQYGTEKDRIAISCQMFDYLASEPGKCYQNEHEIFKKTLFAKCRELIVNPELAAMIKEDTRKYFEQ